MTNIIIADDHDIVREGLISILEGEGNIQIIGIATDGKEALTLIENNDVDVAILDIEMPEINGNELTGIIKEKFPAVKVLILTMHAEIGYIRSIMEVGADGYIIKNKSKEDLVLAIKAINQGKDFFSEEVKQTVMNSLRSTTVEGEIELTKKEIEVLKLIAEGYKSQEIADKLFIVKATADTHRRNLIIKTGAKNAVGLTRFAIASGYIIIE